MKTLEFYGSIVRDKALSLLMTSLNVEVDITEHVHLGSRIRGRSALCY